MVEENQNKKWIKETKQKKLVFNSLTLFIFVVAGLRIKQNLKEEKKLELINFYVIKVKFVEELMTRTLYFCSLFFKPILKNV